MKNNAEASTLTKKTKNFKQIIWKDGKLNNCDKWYNYLW